MRRSQGVRNDGHGNRLDGMASRLFVGMHGDKTRSVAGGFRQPQRTTQAFWNCPAVQSTCKTRIPRGRRKKSPTDGEDCPSIPRPTDRNVRSKVRRRWNSRILSKRRNRREFKFERNSRNRSKPRIPLKLRFPCTRSILGRANESDEPHRSDRGAGLRF